MNKKKTIEKRFGRGGFGIHVGGLSFHLEVNSLHKFRQLVDVDYFHWKKWKIIFPMRYSQTRFKKRIYSHLNNGPHPQAQRSLAKGLF